MTQPTLEDLTLEPDCHESLAEIRDKIEAAELLQRVLALAPFALVLTSNPIGAAFTITTLDWEALAGAVASIHPAAKAACRKVCELEMLRHPGGELHKFWRGMRDSFV